MARVRRRVASVSGVIAAAVVLTVTLPLWLTGAVVVDLANRQVRLPRARLAAFGLCWAWLETAGVVAATGLWLTGRGKDVAAHYRLQRWWAGRLMSALALTCGVRPEVEGVDELRPGPLLVLCRHASLADSLVSAWVITDRAGLRPRYVLKRELMVDPCLDIVGHRLPNHFLDREAPDSEVELQALRSLATGLGPDDVAVIFPEGSRTNPDKRARALTRIAERDPQRAVRLAPLTHLLPPRPAGTRALLDAAPGVDVAVAWHTGFDGLDSFPRILERLAHPLPRVRFVIRRIPRDEVPDDPELQTVWLDRLWLELDTAVRGELEGTR
jgi:1-acyl-sn-glycerol-3-phosphate acyltransferase